MSDIRVQQLANLETMIQDGLLTPVQKELTAHHVESLCEAPLWTWHHISDADRERLKELLQTFLQFDAE